MNSNRLMGQIFFHPGLSFKVKGTKIYICFFPMLTVISGLKLNPILLIKAISDYCWFRRIC